MKKMKYLIFLLFTICIYGQYPDSNMTYPSNARPGVYENPDWESVKHWCIPDTHYQRTNRDNNLGICSSPWDAVVARSYWIKDSLTDSCYLFTSSCQHDSLYIYYTNTLGLSKWLFSGDTIYYDTSLTVPIDYDTLKAYYDTTSMKAKLVLKLDTLTFHNRIAKYFDSLITNARYIDTTEIKKYWDSTKTKAIFIDTTEIKSYWDSTTTKSKFPKDSLYFLFSNIFSSSGYYQTGDTVKIDTVGGGSGSTDSFYVKRTNTFNLASGWLSPNDTLYQDTTHYYKTSDTVVYADTALFTYLDTLGYYFDTLTSKNRFIDSLEIKSYFDSIITNNRYIDTTEIKAYLDTNTTHIDSSTYADTSFYPDSSEVNNWIKNDTFYVKYGNSIGSSPIVDGDTIFIDTNYVRNLDTLGYYFDSLTINSMFDKYFDSTISKALFVDSTEIKAYWDSTKSLANFVDTIEIKSYWDSLVIDSLLNAKLDTTTTKIDSSIYADTALYYNLDTLGYYFDSLSINTKFTNYYDTSITNAKFIDTTEIKSYLDSTKSKGLFIDTTEIKSYYDSTIINTKFIDTLEIKHLSTLLIGDSANFTDFPNAKLIVSEDNTGHTYAFNLGIVGEATGGSVLKAVGVGGVALLGGTKDVFGTFGRAKVGNTSYTGDAIGLKGASEETHAGGRNIGVYSISTGGNLSYSFYGEDGLIFNERSISTNDSISAIGLNIGSGTVIDKMINIGSHFGIIRGSDTCYALSDTTGGTGSVDSFYIKRSNAFNASGWLTPNDTFFVDTTGGGGGTTDSFYLKLDTLNTGTGWITPDDTLKKDTSYVKIWKTLSGRRTGNQEIKIFGTQNLAYKLDGSLFKCRIGANTTFGYIDSCIYSSDSITVTLVTTDTLFHVDSTLNPIQFSPCFKVDEFQRTITLVGEIVADTLYPQGMWYYMQDACRVLPVDAYVVTAAATTPALTFKIFDNTTAMNSTAFDLAGNNSLLRQRLTTNTIARGDRLSMRIISVAGTTKPADFQVIMYVIPQKIYLGE